MRPWRTSVRPPVIIAGVEPHLGFGITAQRDPATAGATVRDAVGELRRLLPDLRLGISALGPRMCALGGEIADVVLLNWSFPDRIAWSRERIATGASAASGPMPRVAGYVRVAIGADALGRLTAEGERYRNRPRPYSRLLDAQDASRLGVPGVAAVDPTEVPALLAPYRAALDSCVVRALAAEPDANGWLEVAAAATLRA